MSGGNMGMRTTRTNSELHARQHEARLIARAQRRDAEAMRELVDLHKDRLFAFIRRMIRSHHDAEDIVQDTFLKAFGSLDSFLTQYRFSTWLFTIGYRLSLNSMRRKQSLTGEVNFGTVASAAPQPDAHAAESDEARRLTALIWSAVDRLSPPQRATVILFYRQNESCREIAQVLELPVATVKSHLHRARTRLRELLEPTVTDETTKLRILAGLAG